jgi:hypothetical protein
MASLIPGNLREIQRMIRDLPYLEGCLPRPTAFTASEKAAQTFFQ